MQVHHADGFGARGFRQRDEHRSARFRFGVCDDVDRAQSQENKDRHDSKYEHPQDFHSPHIDTATVGPLQLRRSARVGLGVYAAMG
ncbi:hypothetical protein FMUBM48_17450 [Nocardia cyriacigeorgica]|nr:hypothetical protein FMUBM48_17450 [Nocardia cyriacigeorgica]